MRSLIIRPTDIIFISVSCRSEASTRPRRAVADPVDVISLPGYTTAELSATRYLTGTRPFVVGDNGTYGGYHNVPLSADTVYVVYFVVVVAWDGVVRMASLYFVVVVAWDGVVKMAFAQLASPVRTALDGVTADAGPTTAVDGPRSAGQNAPSTDNDDRLTTLIIASTARSARLTSVRPPPSSAPRPP